MATAKAVLEVPLYQDVYRPVLKNSPSLQTTDEQNHYIKEILDVACSDSRFAQKAYDAISYILSQEEVPVVPAITSVTPESAPVGTAVTTITVVGTDFVAGTEVLWNGTPVPTNFADSTSVSASVDLTAVVAPELFTVEVQNPVAIKSNSVSFNVTAVTGLSARTGEKKDPGALTHEQVKQAELQGKHPTLERK